MKKLMKCSVLILTLAMVLALTACGSGGAAPAAAPAADSNPAAESSAETVSSEAVAPAPEAGETFNLVMSIEDAVDSPNSVACTAWADEIREASGGRLNIQLYYGATLASPPDVLNLCENGGVDLCWTATAANTGRFPVLDVTNTPGIGHYNSLQCTAAIQKIYAESPEMQKEFDSLNVHLLAMHGSGVSMLATTNKELTSTDSFKGIQLRCNNGNYAAVVQKMGAATMACSQGELYENLEKNVIEGNLADLGNLISTRSYELCKEVMNYSFGCNTGLVCMNKDKYDSLPEDLQKILDDRFDSLSTALGEGFNNYVKDFLTKTCQENGVTVYEPGQEVVDALNAASEEEAHKAWVDAMNAQGYDGQTMLDFFKNCYEEAHTQYGSEYDWVQ